MGILSGVVSYIFGLALNLLDAAIDGFLEALGFDLDSFEHYFPAAADYHEVIVGFAVGLLFIMFIFQIFRNFGIVLDMEAEDPLKTLGKTALFFGMIMSSRSITNYVIKLLVDPYAIFIGAPSSPYEFKLTTLVTGMFNSAFSNPFMSVVVLIMMLVLGWQFLKLCIEVVERYVVFYFVIYTAPVVFATGAFKSTSQIFKSWCRMLGSQAMLLLLNIWSIKLFLSYMPVFESGGSDLGSIFFNFLMGYAFLKFAQKADTLLRILGLSTASTGDMMHSLGGTVAGIAHAIRGIGGGLSKGLSAAAGMFGKGAETAANAANAAGTATSAGANAVGGMIGGALGGAAGGGSGGGSGGGGVPSGESGPSKGVTSSGMSAAKQNFANQVLGSAKDQLGDASDTASQHGLGESMAGQSGEGQPEDNIRMGDRDPQFDPGQLGKVNPRNIDDETMEGLANLAHGIPHDQYDAATGNFSGGGFQEFTGQDANIIGASQIMPADGVEQHQVDLGNGEVGTVYRNSDTGEAAMVQFGSVDNGVIQGTISEIDPNTGALGDHMAFKAVHDSVPGASDFSSHSVPVSDSQGGTYHMATGANTSFFAPGGSSTMAPGGAGASVDSGGGTVHGGAGSSFVPGGDSPMAPPPAPPSSSEPMTGGGGSTRGSGAGREQAKGFASAEPSTGSFGGASGAPVETPPVDSGIGSPASPGGNFVPGGGSTRGGGAGRSSFSRPPSGDIPAPSTSGGGFVSGEGGGSRGGGAGRSSRGGGIGGTLDNQGAPSADSPPVNSGMSAPQSEIRRFSKSNPANMEVFQRGGNVESYSKHNPDSVPLDLDND